MPRPRYRACLQEGLRLNLNKLARQGIVQPGMQTGPRFIRWHNAYSDETIASGFVTADLQDASTGSLVLQLGSLDQRFSLVREERHFGGGQWYFVCPRTHRKSSVLWMPPGASSFASRQAWPRQVAYRSQFETRCGRALSQAQAIRMRLGGADWVGIDEFDPPKPKGMRWRTYDRLVAKSRQQEAIADERIFFLLNQWGKLS